MYASILLPTDGSDGAQAGVRAGLELAAERDSTVHTLYVIDERHVNREYDYVVEDAEEKAEQAVERVEATAREMGVEVEKHVRWGIPHEEIIDAISAYDVDLVTMGTHGRTGFDRLVHLGSVTERVVRRASVKVLTVPIDPRVE